MWKELKAGFLMMTVMTIVTGLLYPAVVTALSQVFFHERANGSLISRNGELIGSRLIGQRFTRPEYFHSRPSSAGSGYDAASSGGSNLGPTSAKLLNGAVGVDDTGKESVAFDGIKLRILHYCIDNDIAFDSTVPIDGFKDAMGRLDDVRLIKAFADDKSPLVVKPRMPIPSDAVTGSASGLDPHISPRNAELQAGRVAKARGITIDQVRAAVARHRSERTFGFLGEPRVNVLELNLSLDDQFPRK